MRIKTRQGPCAALGQISISPCGGETDSKLHSDTIQSSARKKWNPLNLPSLTLNPPLLLSGSQKPFVRVLECALNRESVVLWLLQKNTEWGAETDLPPTRSSPKLYLMVACFRKTGKFTQRLCTPNSLPKVSKWEVGNNPWQALNIYERVSVGDKKGVKGTLLPWLPWLMWEGTWELFPSFPKGTCAENRQSASCDLG